MSIGYACITAGVPNTNLKSCILKNASKEKLYGLITHNLNSLESIIDYNIKNDIKLFRISSELIPFGSSPVNTLPWSEIFRKEFKKIGQKILSSGMRVSMHPGQYTVLNSPNTEVVKRAVADLNYHALVLDSLGVGPENKIILHVGGVYGDKNQAVNRFIKNYGDLDDSLKLRIVLENDDKLYNVCDVIDISTRLKAPIVFDNLHNSINSCDENKSNNFWINECGKTWRKEDGRQKIHYSQQDPLKKIGSHSESIIPEEFLHFYLQLDNKDIDIMLEVKDKNISAVKCIEFIKSGINKL